MKTEIFTKGKNMSKEPKKLNSNGYAYYQTAEYLQPLYASAVACGLDPDTINYNNISFMCWWCTLVLCRI